MSRSSAHNRRIVAFTLPELLLAVTLSGILFTAILSAYLFLGRSLTRLMNLQQQEVQSRRTLRQFTDDASATIALTTASSSQVDLERLISSLVTANNNSFASDTGWWTKNNVNIANGVATASGNGSLSRTSLLTVGKRYRVSCTVTSNPGNITLNDGVTNWVTWTGTGEKSFDAVATGANLVLNLPAGAVIDNVSAIEFMTISYAYANGALTRTDASGTTTLASGVTDLAFTYYTENGSAVTSSRHSVKSVELFVSTAVGNLNSGTLARYTTVSPRIVLRNKATLQ